MVSTGDIVINHFTDEQRIQIYRNNFVISLSEVLAATTHSLKYWLVKSASNRWLVNMSLLSIDFW